MPFDNARVGSTTEALEALLARLEAAEACLLDVWHSSLDDKKLEAWCKAKGE